MYVFVIEFNLMLILAIKTLTKTRFDVSITDKSYISSFNKINIGITDKTYTSS